MSGHIEGDVLDSAGDTAPAYYGFVFGEDSKLR